MARLPLWFIEGMAEYLSVGRVDPHTAMWMRDAVLREDIPTVSDLSSGRYFPYRYGQALLAYVGGRWGHEAVNLLYRRGLQSGVEGAVREVLGLNAEQLSEAWAAALRETYERPCGRRTSRWSGAAGPRRRWGGRCSTGSRAGAR